MDKTSAKSSLVPVENIAQRIIVMRGHRVMLDADLALLYGVTTKRLNEQVRRNLERFPEDFMFQLTAAEYASLRSQIATLKRGRGQHRKFLPYVFTEHGAVMLANVLKSPTAIRASIQVVRAFVKIREMLATRKELLQKLTELERKIGKHDADIAKLFAIIYRLMASTEEEKRKRRPIGFSAEDEEKK